jgi:hypothetical protein
MPALQILTLQGIIIYTKRGRTTGAHSKKRHICRITL